MGPHVVHRYPADMDVVDVSYTLQPTNQTSDSRAVWIQALPAPTAVYLLARVLAMTAPPQTLENRVAKLEEFQSDMMACYRIRLSGCPTLEKRCLEFFNGDRKFWVLKDKLLTLVLKDLEGPLQAVFPDTSKLASVLGELKEVLGTPPALQGVFPVGGKWGEHVALDVKWKPGLIGLRATDLVKMVIGPQLREASTETKVWVPLSSGEMARRRKRKASPRAASRENTRGPARRSRRR